MGGWNVRHQRGNGIGFSGFTFPVIFFCGGGGEFAKSLAPSAVFFLAFSLAKTWSSQQWTASNQSGGVSSPGGEVCVEVFRSFLSKVKIPPAVMALEVQKMSKASVGFWMFLGLIAEILKQGRLVWFWLIWCVCLCFRMCVVLSVCFPSCTTQTSGPLWAKFVWVFSSCQWRLHIYQRKFPSTWRTWLFLAKQTQLPFRFSTCKNECLDILTLTAVCMFCWKHRHIRWYHLQVFASCQTTAKYEISDEPIAWDGESWRGSSAEQQCGDVWSMWIPRDPGRVWDRSVWPQKAENPCQTDLCCALRP